MSIGSGLRAYAISGTIPSSKFRNMGEWVGQEKNANRSSKSDCLIAIAWFVFGTITEGCGCEECDARRDMVMALIYDCHLSPDDFRYICNTTE